MVSEPSFFRFEWHDGGAIAGPELAATFARLEITIDGLRATRAIDRSSQSVRDALYVPLYPVAEWLARSYWRLLAEPENRCGAGGFADAHDLARADRAYALPALWIVPAGESVRIRLHQRRFEHQPLELIEEGERWVSGELLRKEVWRLIEAVRGRLRDRRVERTLLDEIAERRAAEEGDAALARHCRLAASLGADPDELPEPVAETLERLEGELPSATLEELCATVGPAELAQSAGWLAQVREQLAAGERRPSGRPAWPRVMELAPARPRPSFPIAELREAVRDASRGSRSGPPWRWGYAAAERVRPVIGRMSADPVELLPSVLVDKMDGIRALVFAPDGNEPRIAVTARTQTGQRFARARALFHVLVTGAREPRLVSNARTELQMAGRAFAAELLAPVARIRERLPTDGEVDPDTLEEIASELGVSTEVVRHQIENHGLARIAAA